MADHPPLRPFLEGRIEFGQVGVFAGLPEAQLVQLERRLPAVRWTRGSPPPAGLVRDDCLFVIREGRLGLLETPAGHPVMIALLGRGSLYSTLGPAPTPALRLFDDDASVSPIPRRAVAALVARYPRLALNLADALTERVAMLRETVAALSAVRVEDRLRARLHQLVERHGVATPEGARLHLVLTHAQWGEVVGASREAVSASFARLRAEGAVVTDEDGVVIPWAAFAPAGATGDEPREGER
ncbi:Crp/Fnr family transcriptional regulator [Miltoncostaea marina]|uniref:Crp/Fnr family transcriptional regulator n=1 Tax=Miltoncostaea marina TaxID=2843215 RepID=UPI001C3E5F58|nr:Crp/Fnr family transcriptional regulator [Miltoncostaea marina]